MVQQQDANRTMNCALVQPQQHAPGAVSLNLNACRVDHATGMRGQIVETQMPLGAAATIAQLIFDSSRTVSDSRIVCGRDAFNQDTDALFPMCPCLLRRIGNDRNLVVPAMCRRRASGSTMTCQWFK